MSENHQPFCFFFLLFLAWLWGSSVLFEELAFSIFKIQSQHVREGLREINQVIHLITFSSPNAEICDNQAINSEQIMMILLFFDMMMIFIITRSLCTLVDLLCVNTV